MKNNELIKNSTVVILLGGKSSRMNYVDKYTLKIGKNSFLDCILDEVSCFDNILISCNKNQDTSNFKYKYTVDEIDEIGPIGGIYSAMNNVESEILFLCSCDMPYINKEIIDILYSNYESSYDCIIPCVGEDIYPLFGIYNANLKNIVKENIDNKNYKIKNILDRVNTKYIEFGKEYIPYFRNINTPQEYEEFCDLKWKKYFKE